MKALWFGGDKGVISRRDTPLSIGIGIAIPAASEICYLRPPICLHKHSTNLAVSLPKKRSIYPFSSVSTSDTQIQAETQDEETETHDNTNQIQTVHVRFQLQRECSFGQHFYIVGDDPLLGQWDPLEAVPFNWSDGHVWFTELDIPTGKCIKFKIILKDGSENIIWQPGPDRILQTGETQNTITVYEDWDGAELQKIVEGKLIFNQITESVSIEDDITSSQKEVNIGKDNYIPARRSDSNANESPADISDNDMLGGNGSMVTLTESTDEMLSRNRLPLLVPGLNPLPKTQPKEEPLEEVEKNILSDASVEADIFEPNMQELKFEEVLVNNYQEQHQPVQVEKLQFFEDEDASNPKSFDLVLGNDIQWGLRTLQELVAKLRFW